MRGYVVGVLVLVAEVLYLFAPLLLSAALSGLVMRADWLAWLKRPIDGGRSWRGQRVFGSGKTWRGVFIAVVGCSLGVAVQKYLIGARAAGISRVRYEEVSALAFGTAMGLAAMLGELPNSFVKRRLGIASGKTTQGWLALVFYVWDQVDLLTLSWPVLAPWVRVDASLVLTSFLVAMLVHPLSSLIGYAIGARKSAR